MTSMKNPKTKQERLKQYDRHMLRSAFVSLFWNAIMTRRRTGKFTLQSLAKKAGTNKAAVSRWFSGQHPNWEVDTIADVASALDLDLDISAKDRLSGVIITPTRVQVLTIDASKSKPVVTETSAPPPVKIIRGTEPPATSAKAA